MERIGEEVSETLEYTPAKLLVIEHVRAKHACRKDGESTIRTAFTQPSPLPKSNAEAGLLAQILVATYADHLPLNCQKRIFKRHATSSISDPSAHQRILAMRGFGDSYITTSFGCPAGCACAEQ